MALVSRMIFPLVKWRARRRLAPGVESFADNKRKAARRGISGETFACWYLRGNGYVFIAGNFIPRGAKGQIDPVGYDRDTLAFVEVRTRTAREDQAALPKLSVTPEKQELVARTARRFLQERHVQECPMRFDVVAIEEPPGQSPAVRLH